MDLLIQRQQGCGIYCLCKNDKDVLPVNIMSRMGKGLIDDASQQQGGGWCWGRLIDVAMTTVL